MAELLLQMQHSLLDLLRPPLIPELRSDIAAGTSCHIQLVLVSFAAVRALPLQLAVLCCHDLDLSGVTAHLAVITLCVQLSIHDIIVNKPHYLKHCRYVVLHIRHFHITDRAACREGLEL